MFLNYLQVKFDNLGKRIKEELGEKLFYISDSNEQVLLTSKEHEGPTFKYLIFLTRGTDDTGFNISGYSGNLSVKIPFLNKAFIENSWSAVENSIRYIMNYAPQNIKHNFICQQVSDVCVN